MEAGIFDGQAFSGGGAVERLIRRNQRYRREARKPMIALDVESYRELDGIVGPQPMRPGQGHGGGQKGRVDTPHG
jgi:hypothetical protein